MELETHASSGKYHFCIHYKHPEHQRKIIIDNCTIITEESTEESPVPVENMTCTISGMQLIF